MADDDIIAIAADKSEHRFPAGTSQDIVNKVMKNYATRERSITEVPGEALSNIGPSAERLATSMAQPFIHPIETGENIERTVTGALAKVVPGASAAAQENISYADALGQMVKERYGSWKNFKHTLATDPLGAAADMSLFLTGGGGIAARAPGIVGKVGEVAQAAGRLEPVTKVAGKAATGVQGLLTGKGGEPFAIAARAGREGGARGEELRASMAGATPVTEIAEEARGAVKQLRQERGQLYKSGMVDVSKDKTILNFNDIDQAISDAMRVSTFKGQELDEPTRTIRDNMIAEVNKWKMLDPKEFHTPEGMDALKRKLGKLVDAIGYDKPSARLAAGEIYNAVRDEIVKQVPVYAKVMQGYETASNEIKAIERELSLNPKASVDTALRKITAALREGVNTNYGRRRDLVDFLAQHGATHLLEKIAGQSLKQLMPEGLARLAGSGEGAAALLAVLAGNPLLAAKIAAVMAAHSPRLHGEIAFRAGQASRLPLPEISLSVLQAGRLGAEGARALGATAMSPQGTEALEQPGITAQ